MKRFVPLLVMGISIAYANVYPCTHGTTYQINQCLLAKQQAIDKALAHNQNISPPNLKAFEKSRQNLCQLVANRYQGGSFESIAYGQCYLSLSKWFVQQMRL